MRSINVCLTTILLTSGVWNVLSAPPMLADEPPAQSTPSTSMGGETSAQEQAPPGREPAPVEEATSPTEGADVQERGLLPSISSGAVHGGTLQALPPHNAPTPSLNLVANAIQFSSPYTTVIDLRVPANLPVTVPVEISVAYSTTGRRLTQTYAPASGTQIRYVDDLRDGLSRQIRLDVTLRELAPNGNSFTFSTQRTMTPLFNVTVTPLKFFLYSDCDTVGKSDIYLYWASPDNKSHTIRFKLSGGQTREIVEFGWSARNVGLANLFEPGVRFNEEDPDGQFKPGGVALLTRLTPPMIKDFKYIVHEDYDKFCKARVTYRIVLTLL